MTHHETYTASGRLLSELTLEALLRDELTVEDFRIGGETLRRQAEASERAGYVQVARTLRRAAELTALTNERVLEIYDALRPGRATYSQLLSLADHLATECGAPLTAALMREAAEAYLQRGLVDKME
jgi:propanediol dehydratase small subunit